MADGQETIASAPDTAAPSAPSVEPEPVADEPVNLQEPPAVDADEPVIEPEDDLEEFEWNGKPIKGPKGLKDGVLMHKDYTQKTQEVAKTKRELEATAKRVQEQARLYQEDLDKRAEYVSVQKQIERYKQVNWQEYTNQDPIAAQQHWIAYQQLQGEAQTLQRDIEQRVAQRTAAAQQASQEETAKRLQETQEYARKNIKGWTAETDKQVIDFAVAQGVDMDDLRAAMNPTIYKMLYLASLGAKVLDKPAAAPAAKPAPAPLQTVNAKGNAPVRKSLADMNMDEYVAYRRKQQAR